MPRRAPGTLLPVEVDILQAGLDLRRAGSSTFHGFELAKHIAAGPGVRKLTAHGTLYKALARLEDAGLLESVWEDAAVAAGEGRPRRRLYQVTGAGERRIAAWHQQQRRPSSPRRLGLQGSA